MKEETLDRTMWRARFGRGFGPVVRQTAERMNEEIYIFQNPLIRPALSDVLNETTALCSACSGFESYL